MLAENYSYPLCDIGANLCDEMYTGVYNDKKRHENDLHLVLARSRALNVTKTISTAGSVEDTRLTLQILLAPAPVHAQTKAVSWESAERITLAEAYGLYMTAGVHPTRADLFQQDSGAVAEAEEATAGTEQACAQNLSIAQIEAIGGTTGSYTIDQLVSLIHTANKGSGSASKSASNSSSSRRKTVVALGECGLDYARLSFSSREQQVRLSLSLSLSLSVCVFLSLCLSPALTHANLLNHTTTDARFLKAVANCSASIRGPTTVSA